MNQQPKMASGKYLNLAPANIKAKAKATLCLLTAAGLTFHAASHHSSLFALSADVSSFFPSHYAGKLGDAVGAALRSFRAISTIAVVAADYKCNLRLPAESDEYRRELSQVHLRSARKILKLCEANKGFYVKAGQFVAALPQVPKEYSSVLSSLQDQAVPCDFKVIKEVLISNLGPDLSKIFLLLEEQAIAAASIAQVHRATLKDGQEVAVKVQYPGLERQMKIDTITMSFLSKSVSWLFPDYRFHWLVTEFTHAMSLELDFIQEARNSERTAKNFRNNNLVRVPNVFWDLTTSKVLIMQFCVGRKIDDVEFLKEMKINPSKVAKALVEVFAEMIFIHGFVHGDPHPGNILVSWEGPNDFSLVLLDHGIYKQLDDSFREDYCQLWKALILLDSHKIHYLAKRFGIGKYSRYLPIIFTGRTLDSETTLGKGMSTTEKKKLKEELKSLKMEEISSFMESLPPDFITLLRTDGLLRSVIRKLGASQQVRLLAYAKYALRGLSPKSNPESDSAITVAFYRLKTNVSYIQLRLILELLELLSWMKKVKQFLSTLCRKFFGAVAFAIDALKLCYNQ